MYEQVTAYLGKLKPAHWKYPEIQGDGSYEHPYIAGWPEYDEVIYKAIGLDGHDDLSKVDVSKLDGDTILFMIFSRVRGERFSDGLFGRYVENGTLDKWLLRLKELDKGN